MSIHSMAMLSLPHETLAMLVLISHPLLVLPQLPVERHADAVHRAEVARPLQPLYLAAVALDDLGALVLGAHSCSSAMASSYAFRNSGSK